jgi:hypothetical protein
MRAVLSPAAASRHVLRRATAVLLGVAATACAAAAPPAGPAARPPDLTIEVTFGDRERPPSFDPRSPDPRVRKAYAQLVDLLGHDFRFHFDEALLPRWTVDFDTLFAQCIETVVADLARLKRRSPDIFPSGVHDLAGIDAAYSATALEEGDSHLDDAGTVHVVLTPRAWELVPADAVSSALLERRAHALDRSYVGRDPADVPRDEWPAYWTWLQHAKKVPSAVPNPGDDLVYYVDAWHVAAVARFAEVSQPKAPDDLRRDVDAWLVGAARFFGDGYTHHADVVRALPSGAWWKRAETAWVRWAAGAWPTMNDATRVELLRAVLPFGGVAFPGLDVLSMGFDGMGQWIAAGHPAVAPYSEHDGRAELYATVVCPGRATDDGRIERASSCDGWYDYALSEEARQKRLLAFLLAKRDAEMVAAVVFGTSRPTDNGLIVASSQWPITLSVWRALAADDALWRSAARVIGDAMPSYGAPLYDEAVLTWRRTARLRGPLLYVIAAIGRDNAYLFKWEDLAGSLGAPIARGEFDAFLAMSPRALALAASTWPALGSGWSRADVLAAHLDGALDDARSTDGGVRQVASAIEGIGDRMCVGGDPAHERERLRRAVSARARAHPDEARGLSSAIDALAETCK